MKKATMFVLAAALTISMTGCGSSQKETEAPKTEAATEAKTEAKTEAATEKVTEAKTEADPNSHGHHFELLELLVATYAKLFDSSILFRKVLAVAAVTFERSNC